MFHYFLLVRFLQMNFAPLYISLYIHHIKDPMHKKSIKIKIPNQEFNPSFQDLQNIVIPPNVQGALMVKIAQAISEINIQLLAIQSLDSNISPSHFDFILKLALNPNDNNYQNIVVQVSCID